MDFDTLASMGENAGRRLSVEGIVCLSSIDWDFLWQAHQEVMSRFASKGSPVLFVENTGVRAPRLSDLPRVVRRIRNWWGGVGGFRERAPNLIVLSPLLLPFPYSKVCRRFNAWLLTRSITKWVGATKRSSPILFTFLPTPLANDIVDELDPALVVYYCADNLAASSISAEAILGSERLLFERADLVFVTSRAILTRATKSRETAHLFPFGVDFKKFVGRRTNTPAPADVAEIPNPIIGYVGGIHRWFDVELLKRVASSRPDFHFVLIGPEQTDVSPLRGLENIHFLGPKPHDSLPDYIARFDVAIIPYRLTEYTESVYPTKLNEYFALGIPVLSTPLPEVEIFNREHGDLVRVARDAEGFAAILDETMKNPSFGRAARIAAAEANGWDQRVEKMSQLMVEELGRKRGNPRLNEAVFPRLKRGWRRRIVALIVAVSVAALGFGYTPLPWLLADPMRLTAPLTFADAALILGGGAGESGVIGQGHQERMERAIALHSAGLVSRIVICSGKVQRYSESEIMRAIALAKGISDGDILVEQRADGTRQMLAEAARRAREQGWRKVVIVSSPYHMRRALMVWSKLAPDIEALPAPVTKCRFYGYDESRRPQRSVRGATATQLLGLAQELVTLGYYRIRGWI